MARKDLLKSVIGQPTDTPVDGGRSSYAMRGASKSMKVSIDSLAENSKRLLEGETIVEIDPGLIDASFVNDRLSGDDEAFEELKASIAASGQDTPVLLRPHPEAADRYMVVFGHRRVRAARALGRPVRAVVKEMDDVAHVLAQGQENTARADLSFIEKALFAKNLADLGQAKEVIQQALTIDGTLLSRMLSVASTVPTHVIAAIGPAKQIGRDRWEDFKKLMAVKSNLDSGRSHPGHRGLRSARQRHQVRNSAQQGDGGGQGAQASCGQGGPGQAHLDRRRRPHQGCDRTVRARLYHLADRQGFCRVWRVSLGEPRSALRGVSRSNRGDIDIMT